MTIHTKTIVTTVLLALSTIAIADEMNKEVSPTAPKIQEEFSALDNNSDGKLTQEEVNANPELASLFVELDANSNGDVDMSEYVLYNSPATSAGKPEETVQ